MKKKPVTPRSKIRVAIRQLWLRSRERAEALKRDKYTCQTCKRKQTMKKGQEFKVQVHHKKGIANWDKIIDAIYEEILCNPEELETICEECHLKEHGGNTYGTKRMDVKKKATRNSKKTKKDRQTISKIGQI